MKYSVGIGIGTGFVFKSLPSPTEERGHVLATALEDVHTDNRSKVAQLTAILELCLASWTGETLHLVWQAKN